MVIDSSRTPQSILLACSLILILSALYLAANRSLSSTLEGESAEIAREFLEGPSLIVNHLNGQEDLDKPALYYWVIALVSKIAPSWELAARLPSIVSIFLIALAIYLIQAPTDPPMFFPLTCFIMAASPKVLLMSQTARMDMLFTAACFGAMVGFYLYWEKAQEKIEDVGSPISFFILAAGAVMLKGPVGAILTFCPVVVFLCINRKWRMVKRVFLSKGIVVFLALILPWYLAATLETDFRFFHRFILEENLSRFTSLIPGGAYKDFSHHPINRYFIYFLVGFFPWSMIWPFWVYDVIRNWKKKDGRIRLFFIYFAFVFIFFTLAISKRSDYILPLYPAGALITALYALERPKSWQMEVPFITFFGLLFIAGISLSLLAVLLLSKGTSTLPHFLSKLKELETFSYFLSEYPFLPRVLVLLTVVSFFGLISKWVPRNRGWGINRLSLFSILMTFSIAILVSVLLTTLYGEKDPRRFCNQVAQLAKDSPLYYYDFWDEECTFYLHRRIYTLYGKKKLMETISREDKAFFIIRERDLLKLDQEGVFFSFVFRKDSPRLRPLVLVSRNAARGKEIIHRIEDHAVVENGHLRPIALPSSPIQ